MMLTRRPRAAKASANTGPFSPPPTIAISLSYVMCFTMPEPAGLSMQQNAATVVLNAAKRDVKWKNGSQ